EKQLVPYDFATRGCAELVALERRLRCAFSEIYIVEIVPGIQRAVTQEIIDGPVKLVCSALGYGVDLRGATSEFRGVRIRLDLELLDFVDRGYSRDRVEVGGSVRRSIQEEVGILRPRSSDRILVADPAANVTDFLKRGVGVFCEGHSGAERGE